MNLVGTAIIFPDETNNSVYIGRIFIDNKRLRNPLYGV